MSPSRLWDISTCPYLQGRSKSRFPMQTALTWLQFIQYVNWSDAQPHQNKMINCWTHHEIVFLISLMRILLCAHRKVDLMTWSVNKEMDVGWNYSGRSGHWERLVVLVNVFPLFSQYDKWSRLTIFQRRPKQIREGRRKHRRRLMEPPFKQYMSLFYCFTMLHSPFATIFKLAGFFVCLF